MQFATFLRFWAEVGTRRTVGGGGRGGRSRGLWSVALVGGRFRRRRGLPPPPLHKTAVLYNSSHSMAAGRLRRCPAALSPQCRPFVTRSPCRLSVSVPSRHGSSLQNDRFVQFEPKKKSNLTVAFHDRIEQNKSILYNCLCSPYYILTVRGVRSTHPTHHPFSMVLPWGRNPTVAPWGKRKRRSTDLRILVPTRRQSVPKDTTWAWVGLYFRTPA